MHWLSKKRYIVGLLAPTFIIYLIYIILPIFMAIRYSFTRFTGIGQPTFIGLSNYRRLFGDFVFWRSLGNTFSILGIAFLLLLVGSFFLALLLNNRLKFANFSKALIFSPAIIAPIVVGIIWIFILDPEVGLINAVLGSIGLESWKQQWIGGRTLTPFSIGVIYFWQQLGYITTIYIAGLKMISNDILEAVSIDGANGIQKLRYITIPLMKSTVSIVGILLITGIFRIFELVIQTTGGGPNRLSETMVTYSYSITFRDNEYGYGMAIAVMTFFISLIVIGVFIIIMRNREGRG